MWSCWCGWWSQVLNNTIRKIAISPPLSMSPILDQAGFCFLKVLHIRKGLLMTFDQRGCIKLEICYRSDSFIKLHSSCAKITPAAAHASCVQVPTFPEIGGSPSPSQKVGLKVPFFKPQFIKTFFKDTTRVVYPFIHYQVAWLFYCEGTQSTTWPLLDRPTWLTHLCQVVGLPLYRPT